MQQKSCSETSSKAKRSRTYGKAVAIGGASVRCALLAPIVGGFVASLAAAGGDDVGWTGFGGSFVGADFFCFLVSGSSPESSDSTAFTAAAAVLLQDVPALPFLDIEADATPWSSSASLFKCTTTSTRVLSVAARGRGGGGRGGGGPAGANPKHILALGNSLDAAGTSDDVGKRVGPSERLA